MQAPSSPTTSTSEAVPEGRLRAIGRSNYTGRLVPSISGSHSSSSHAVRVIGREEWEVKQTHPAYFDSLIFDASRPKDWVQRLGLESYGIRPDPQAVTEGKNQDDVIRVLNSRGVPVLVRWREIWRSRDLITRHSLFQCRNLRVLKLHNCTLETLPPVRNNLAVLCLVKCKGALPAQNAKTHQSFLAWARQWNFNRLCKLQTIAFYRCTFPLLFEPTDGDSSNLSELTIDDHWIPSFAQDQHRRLEDGDFGYLSELPARLVKFSVRNSRLTYQKISGLAKEQLKMLNVEGCNLSRSINDLRWDFPNCTFKGFEEVEEPPPGWKLDLERLVMGQPQAIAALEPIVKIVMCQASQNERLNAVKILRGVAEATGEHSATLGKAVAAAVETAGRPKLADAAGALAEKGAKQLGKLAHETSAEEKTRERDTNRRPQAVMYFAGPAGTGKTSLTKALATVTDRPIIEIDMGSKTEESAVAELKGAAPSYIGFNQTETIVDRVNEEPDAVILFNEMELGHARVWKTLMGIFDGAKLEDSRGHVANFDDTIIVMTSNLGAEELAERGLWQEPDALAIAKKRVEELLEKTTSGAFASRIDVVPFKPIDRPTFQRIMTSRAESLEQEALKNHGITLKIEKSSVDYYIGKNISPTQGVRPAIRAFEKKVDELIADGIARKRFEKDKSCQILIPKAKQRNPQDTDVAIARLTKAPSRQTPVRRR